MADSANAAAHTILEAADRLRISRSSVYKLIQSGQLRRVKIGQRSIIPASEVDRLIAEGTKQAAS